MEPIPMKRTFFRVILCSAVALLVLTTLLNADEIKNTGLVQSIGSEYQTMPKRVDTSRNGGEDRVLNEQVVKRAMAKARGILRPHDELPIYRELKEQVRAPYKAEMKRFKAQIKEQFSGSDWTVEELMRVRGDHAREFAAKVESHCREAMDDGRFHEAFLVHEVIHNGGGSYDGGGHKARLRMMAYETYLRLARQAADRLTQIGNRLIALHAGNRDSGFEIVVAPPENERTDIDRLEERRREIATWLQERKHGCPGWPDDWHVEAGWSCRVGDREITGNVFSVGVSLRDDHKPLARQMRERVEDLVQRTSWRLNEHAQSLGGRAAALVRFDDLMEVHTGSGFAVFRPRWIEQAFVVLLPDGCDALLVNVSAFRTWPDDLVRRNPVVVDEIVNLLVNTFVGGGVPYDQSEQVGARMELAPLTSTNVNTSPNPKSTCSLQVVVNKPDGRPLAGTTVTFKKPKLGSLSAMRVITDARGQALLTYTAPTENELAATSKKEAIVYINARVPATGAQDIETLKVRSLTGALSASVEHDILPAHPDYYNRIEFRFKAADKPDGRPYKARITASQQWGAVVKNIHEPGGGRIYEMDVWPNSDCVFYYHWTGPPSMMQAADETVTVEIFEKNLKYDVTFSVGMDLRIVAVERKHGGPLFPVMWEPFHVYIEDKFHPKADLGTLLKKFRIETDLKIEQIAYEPAAPDYTHGSLVSVLITRIEGLSANALQQAVVWDAGSWQVSKTTDNRYVLIQRGKYEDDTPWQEYPAVVFWERGTYRFQVTIKPGPFDADPRNNALPSPSLQIEEFRGFTDEVIHTVFLPSLEFLAGASLSFTKEGAAMLAKTSFCLKGLIGDGLAGDYTNVLIDAWGCALTGLDKANLSKKIKDTFKLQEVGTYIASLTKGLYEWYQHKESITREEPVNAHTRSRSPLGPLMKGLYDEVQGKKGALANVVVKTVLGDQNAATSVEKTQGAFSLDDVLHVSQLALKGMQGHYVVIVQRKGLQHYIARTSGGMQLTRAPGKLGPGKSPAARIEETATTVVIPMRNDERLILELGGTGSHGQLITVTPDRIGRYDYPDGSWHSTVAVDSSGMARFSNGQSLVPAHQPMASPDEYSSVPASFAGKWNTDFGTLTVTQHGNEIRGEYPHDRGKIEGVIEGNVVRGRWSEGPSYKPPRDAGDFEFEFSKHGTSFKGKWSYGFGSENWNSTWNGEKIN
jgi:hypothetical protein